MAGLMILIPSPVSISIYSSINVLLQSLVFIMIAKLLLFHGKRSALKLFSSNINYPEDDTTERDDIPTSSSSTTPDFGLPDDVLAEILCWLPVKQLLICKSVSKSWNKLISDVCIPSITSSSFQGLFLPLNPASGGGWDFTSITGIERKIYDSSFVKSCVSIFPSIVGTNSIFDCYNGELLYQDQKSQILYLSDLCTQQCIALPKPPKHSMPRSAALTSKLNMYVVYVRRRPLRILSYCWYDQRWTQLTDRHLLLDNSILAARWISRYVFCDGCLYVLSMSGHLLQFDIKQLAVSVRAIQLPHAVQGKRAVGCMGLSQGHLHYAWCDIAKFKIFIWMLDGCNLTLKHTISLLSLLWNSGPGFFGRLSKMAVYAFHPSSDIIFFGNNVGIFSYDLCSKQVDCVCKLRMTPSMHGDGFLVFPFSQNLASLRTFIGNTKKLPKGCGGSKKLRDNEDVLVHQ